MVASRIGDGARPQKQETEMAQQIVVESPPSPQLGQLGAIQALNLVGEKLGKHAEALKADYAGVLETMVNDQGLVRMFFYDDEAPYQKGTMAGLPPDQAILMLVYERAAPCDENGNFLPLKVARRKPEAKAASFAVQIPDGWEQMHHLQRLRLAREVAGRNQTDLIELGEADDILRTEFDRRKQQ